jgi:hypothetical protein
LLNIFANFLNNVIEDIIPTCGLLFVDDVHPLDKFNERILHALRIGVVADVGMDHKDKKLH